MKKLAYATLGIVLLPFVYIFKMIVFIDYYGLLLFIFPRQVFKDFTNFINRNHAKITNKNRRPNS